MLSTSSVSKSVSIAQASGAPRLPARKSAAPALRLAHKTASRAVPCMASTGWAPVPPTPRAMLATVSAITTVITAPIVARAVVACTLGAGVRAALQKMDAEIIFPENAMMLPTLKQRANAVNCIGALASLLCFLLIA